MSLSSLSNRAKAINIFGQLKFSGYKIVNTGETKAAVDRLSRVYHDLDSLAIIRALYKNNTHTLVEPALISELIEMRRDHTLRKQFPYISTLWDTNSAAARAGTINAIAARSLATAIVNNLPKLSIAAEAHVSKTGSTIPTDVQSTTVPSAQPGPAPIKSVDSRPRYFVFRRT